MFIVDAHEDIAYNALHHDRDVRRSTAEQRAREAAAPNGSAAEGALTGTSETVMIGLPELRCGGVGLVCFTIFCLPSEQEAMTADAWAQVRYYQGLAAAPGAFHPLWNDTRTGHLELFTTAFPVEAQP